MYVHLNEQAAALSKGQRHDTVALSTQAHAAGCEMISIEIWPLLPWAIGSIESASETWNSRRSSTELSSIFAPPSVLSAFHFPLSTSHLPPSTISPMKPQRTFVFWEDWVLKILWTKSRPPDQVGSTVSYLSCRLDSAR